MVDFSGRYLPTAVEPKSAAKPPVILGSGVQIPDLANQAVSNHQRCYHGQMGNLNTRSQFFRRWSRDFMPNSIFKHSLFIHTFRFLASLQLAVVMLVLLAAVLSWATVVETQHGRAYAQWYVYSSPWFVGLLGLLGVNIFCAAAIRFPWQRHQTGFVITHLGLLTLLFGSVHSFLGGMEGRVSLGEGESTQHMVLADRSQITATWVGRPQEPPYDFIFSPGPADWRPARVLKFGVVGGVGMRILRYHQQAQLIQEWEPDATQQGGPVVKISVTGKDGVRVAEEWLPDHRFGEALALGPLKVQLERAATDQMVTDFLQPPIDKLGEKGLLAIYDRDAAYHVSVDECVGQKVPLGNTGVAVEIAEYLPNAIPDRLGKFSSKGDHAKNPLVELRVHLPGELQPLRQISLAKEPLLNLDGVYGRECPVKFRYYHPVVKPSPALEMLQTSDGRLHGRVFMAGKFSARDELKVGEKIELPGNFELTIVAYLPHARHTARFEPLENRQDGKKPSPSEPVVLAEVTAFGATQTVWLRRNDLEHGRQIVTTPQGPLMLSHEYAKEPLGCSLTLLDFRREKNPGEVGNASFASRVRVHDRQRDLDAEHVISMNHPLRHRQFTFYQSGFDDAGHGREVSSFTVAYDPGRITKYCGSLMICAGIAVMFFMRAYFFRRVGRRSSRRSRNPVPLGAGHSRTTIALESQPGDQRRTGRAA